VSVTFRVLRHVVLGPYVQALSRLRVHGQHHLPRTGPVIVAANHQSFADSLVLQLATGRQVHFLGKSDYFTGRRLTAAFFRSVGVIPVDRAGGDAAAAALRAAEQVLDDGRCFGIYPEGTRTLDGKLHRGKTGAARIALATGIPVVPCGLVGTYRLQPPDARLLRPARTTARFGPALLPTGSPRELTDAIMAAIQDLTGLDYVDHYAVPPRRG
jgi:1-acyl-sn-glycerol-3-phosphate acyltransferase